MTRASERVDRMMHQKVDPARLWRVEHPNMYEKLVLELAEWIGRNEATERGDEWPTVTPWEAQVAAAEMFNQRGFVATLDYRVKLEEKVRMWTEGK